MHFQLNYKSGKPVYVQLVEQVRRAAASGLILPGIRPLAEHLRVNRNTVAKAYAELENQRIVETVAGKGCFIRANSSPFRKDVRRKLLAESIDDAVAHAHQLQIDKHEFLRLAEERYELIEQKRSRAALA